VCLTEIFRQAQKSLIVTNAHRVIHGEHPVLNRTDSDFFFMPRETSEAVSDTLVSLVSKRLPDAYGFSPILDIQVLCPSKRGECGTQSLNRRLQAVLNPPARTKNELRTAGGRVFREGDRVMQTKNNYDLDVFNGDIGTVVSVDTGETKLSVSFGDKEVEYTKDRLDELDLAYATTIHKSQGSEYRAVIIPVHRSQYILLQRQLLYTAVTRAKELCIMVGERKALKMGIDRQPVNDRNTDLKELLTRYNTTYDEND
jgi:exodeoxyribonuclease V alpha subunit